VTLALGGVCAGLSAQAPAQAVTIEQHEAAMKQIAQSNGAMQKLVKASDLMAAGKEAQTLVTQFTLVERFWTQNKKDDAMKLAATARQGASDVVAANGRCRSDEGADGGGEPGWHVQAWDVPRRDPAGRVPHQSRRRHQVSQACSRGATPGCASGLLAT
jgi:hypothetical protein